MADPSFVSWADPLDETAVIVMGGGGVHEYDLVYSGKVLNGETITKGQICSLDSDGLIVKGLSSNTAVPMIAMNGTADLSSGQTRTDISKTENATGAQQGNLNALVCVRGYEVRTTAYDTTKTYTSGSTLLTVGSGDEKGNVTPSAAAHSTNVIVGAISRGKQTASYGSGRQRTRDGQTLLLYYWTHWTRITKTS